MDLVPAGRAAGGSPASVLLGMVGSGVGTLVLESLKKKSALLFSTKILQTHTHKRLFSPHPLDPHTYI